MLSVSETSILLEFAFAKKRGVTKKQDFIVMLSERSETKHLNKANTESINADSIKDKKITEFAFAKRYFALLRKAQYDDALYFSKIRF